MRIGSLFSGAGGLDLAALELFPGSSMAWHSEIEPAAAKVLAHRWPDVPNLGDVTAVDWSTIEPVDVLTAGYPCQPFSAAGQRKGTNDERHLWPYVQEAIRRLRPRFTLLENVAGHRSLGFDRVLGDMAEDGLHVRWASVRASDVGCCHRRERLFILVGRSYMSAVDGGGVSALLPTPQVADVTGGHRTRSGARSNELLLPGVAEAYAAGTLLPTPRATDGTKGGPNQRGSSGDLMLPSAVAQLLPTPNASDGSGGGQHPDKRVGHSQQLIDYALIHGSPRWGEYEPAIRRQELLSRPAPSPTEPNTKGNQRLSAAFAEWMMLWPAGWVTDPAIGLSRNDQLRVIGNGVVPRQAVAAFSQLLAAIGAPIEGAAS